LHEQKVSSASQRIRATFHTPRTSTVKGQTSKSRGQYIIYR